MLGGADNSNGELPSYIIGANNVTIRYAEFNFYCRVEPGK